MLVFFSFFCYTNFMLSLPPIKLKTIIQINNIYSLYYFSYSKKYQFVGESHDFWEFVYCDSGGIKVTDNGNEYTFEAGSAFLHAPNHFHTLSANDQFSNVIVFTFDGDINLVNGLQGKVLKLNREEKSFLKNLLVKGLSTFRGKHSTVYYVSSSPSPYSEKSFILNEIGNEQIIKNYIEILLISIYQNNLSAKNSSKELKTPNLIVENIKKILEENIYCKIQLKDISKRLNYSETHLQNLFKQSIGMTIKQYYISLKINRAKELLSESNYTISQISETLNFENPHHFSQAFKKVTNMSPSAYLKSIENGVL